VHLSSLELTDFRCYRSVELALPDGVTVLVGDNGVGGAQFTPEGGLLGIERRLAAFDGTLSMASPLGGPTIITIKVPCILRATASA